jgi:hypothetical protein
MVINKKNYLPNIGLVDKEPMVTKVSFVSLFDYHVYIYI